MVCCTSPLVSHAAAAGREHYTSTLHHALQPEYKRRTAVGARADWRPYMFLLWSLVMVLGFSFLLLSAALNTCALRASSCSTQESDHLYLFCGARRASAAALLLKKRFVQRMASSIPAAVYCPFPLVPHAAELGESTALKHYTACFNNSAAM